MTYFYQIHTWQDFKPLCRTLHTLQQHDPAAYVQVISDGKYMTEDEKAFVKEHCAEFIEGDRQMPWAEGGTSWIERRFRLAVATGKDICIKLDTDTRVWRKFLYIPNADYFGTVYKAIFPSGNYYVQGGCLCTSRRLMQAIVDGKFVGGPEWLAAIPKWAKQPEASAHLISGDLVLAEVVARELNILPVSWDEVHSVYIDVNGEVVNPLINNKVPRYAITHPHANVRKREYPPETPIADRLWTKQGEPYRCPTT